MQRPVVKHPFLSPEVWRGFLHIWGARCDWEGSVGEGLGRGGKVFPEKYRRSRKQRRSLASTGFWPLHEGRKSLTQRRLHCYGGTAWLIVSDKSWRSGSRLLPVWGEAGETPRRTWRTRGQPRLLCRPNLDQQTHNVSKVISWSLSSTTPTSGWLTGSRNIQWLPWLEYLVKFNVHWYFHILLLHIRGNYKVSKKTGVKHVALCPWFAETGIIDSTTRELVMKKSPLKFVSVERVGEAFQLAVEEQR